MNLSEVWIRRPVMTTLVVAGLLLLGLLSYRQLPINNLPDVDFPTITISAALPGANPETMAASVATPLEKKLSAISGVDSMSSTSTLGKTSITIQFALSRDIDAAALDVSAALNAAASVLPLTMPNPPTYQKVNPSDMPVVFLALTSETVPITELHDLAETILLANLSAIDGVAEVDLAPPQKHAVRVQVNPDRLAARGVGIDEVARTLATGNANLPGGTLDNREIAYTLNPRGQLLKAADYEKLVVAWEDGYPVRVSDLGRAVDGVENDRASSKLLEAGRKTPTIVVRIRKQTGANTVRVAGEVKRRLPRLSAALPAGVTMKVLYDQSSFIHESIRDVQLTMVLTIALVVAVVFLFLRAPRPTLIPSLVVPLSIVVTFPVMSLCGYTLNTLSLMALTLSIGFVVDDAIVVLENVIRRMEGGEGALEASLRGSREIGFTVLSMTVSLAVVFVPILFMGGILGRLFREFAVSIIVAILLSGFFSLTLTPMLTSRLLAHGSLGGHGRPHAASERALGKVLGLYGRTLRAALRHRPAMLVLTAAVAAGTVVLYRALPAGFIPSQDQGFFRIFTQVEDRTSYQGFLRRQADVEDVIASDPEVEKGIAGSVVGLGSENTGITFVTLRPREERETTVDQVIARLRPRLAAVPGLVSSLVNPPLITIGSRLATAQWQLTLQGTETEDLYRSAPLLEERMRGIPILTDVKSDLQLRKPQVEVEIDRDKASSLGLTVDQVEDAFYSAYAARQVSTIYTAKNYYYVILELEPRFREDPRALEKLFVRSAAGKLVPVTAVTRLRETVAPLSVNHAGQIPSVTVNYNLAPGASIGDAVARIEAAAREVLPRTVATSFSGTAQAFRESFASMGFLLLVTVVLIYIVLGVLYESYVHPLTILTALPLAGFGALLALRALGMELDLYAMVGMILLVGIVKKNGIMMVDFALDAERTRGLTAEESILEACLVRFRPIMMTTLAALLGTLPIALGLGAGGEARASLGVAVVGGLVFSQLLTLYVTPVFYVLFDGMSRAVARREAPAAGGAA